jgi:ATPase subunit of ABC transporter with duplicated ATPase domains
VLLLGVCITLRNSCNLDLVGCGGRIWISPRTTSDIESIIWFEEFLKSYSGALLMTSHDREFMNRIVTRIAEIDGGEIIAYSGNYDLYERERTIRETNQQAAFVRSRLCLPRSSAFWSDSRRTRPSRSSSKPH